MYVFFIHWVPEKEKMKKILLVFVFVVYAQVSAFADDCTGAGQTANPGGAGCVCNYGYYGDGITCTKCGVGLITMQKGATSSDDCKEPKFQYGANQTWTWPEAVKLGELKTENIQ